MTEVERGVESDGTEDYWSDEDDERMLQVDDECVLSHSSLPLTSVLSLTLS